MLDEFNPNDANSLNSAFYEELLYILGLCEVKESSKLLIKPSSQSANTLYNAILAKLPQDKQDFESVMSFVVLWLNRILFLKLIEANLVRFNDDESLKFLNPNKVRNFKALSQLFFEILAKKPKDRANSTLDYLPYLNSALFQKQAIEREILDIQALDDNATLPYFAKTQIKDKNAKKKAGSVSLLAYIFEFLDAFDFGSDEKSPELALQKELISSSVLGLVFEKLNGYKEGSFYTPSFITSYMCRASLEKVVLSKFNDKFKWQCENLKALRESVDRDFSTKAQEFKAVLNSIRICDPAVGSGHFLVSALNEMIAIYHALGLAQRLNPCELALLSDELVITKPNGEIYAYKKPKIKNDESHAIQKALFTLKKQIIENNLFGVDINENSCEITKLRLWIELLKNSYYLQKDDEGFDENLNDEIHQMQTLPNIDINIKCGNSLISYFELNRSLTHYPNIKERMQKYKSVIKDYKESFFDDKMRIEKEIKALKESFRTFCFKDKFNKEIKAFTAKCEAYSKKYGNFLAKDDENLSLYIAQSFSFFDLDESKARLEFSALKKEYESIFNLENKKPFEWRFEFPEVLNENGEFMGFDLVVGNPPYIDYRKIDEQTKGVLAKNSAIYKDSKEGSIYVYFIERSKEILSKNGSMIFINPISYICQEAGFGLRNFIDKNLSLNLMLNVSNLKVFDSAATYTCINHFTHKNKGCKTLKFGVAKEKGDLLTINLREIEQCKIENLSLLLHPITTKIFKANYPKLNEFCEIFCGLSKAGFRTSVEFDKKETNHPFLEASDIFRYEFKQGKFLSQIPFYYSQDKIDIFKNKEIIFMARMTNFIRCCVAPSGYFGGKVNILYDFKVDKRYILGLLNSKLMSYFYAQKYFASHMQGGAFGFDTLSVGNLPIPKITKENQNLADELVKLVNQILALKAKNSSTDTSQLEKDIDNLVFKLYDLNEDDISKITF